MAKPLSTITETRLSHGDVRRKINVILNSEDIMSSVVSYDYKFDTEFNVASFSVELINNAGIFSESGSKAIYLDDEIVVIETFDGSSDEFINFTGYVRQRRKTKTSRGNLMSLTCLDFLVKLEDTDLEKHYEATKISVTNEALIPNFLEPPNQNLSQIFDFVNKNIAQIPPPEITIQEIDSGLTTQLDSGYEIYYETGQIRFGTAFSKDLNIRATYYYYPKSLYIEDIIEDIITEPDGYGQFLFGEASAEDVILNHLTDNFLNVEGSNTDTLTPNSDAQTIIISTILTNAAVANDEYITVEDTTGFPESGTGDINGEAFIWTSKEATRLYGVVTSNHAAGSYVNYKASYEATRIWYLSYSNLVTSLEFDDFSVPGANIIYFDKRQGRIILDSTINPLATVTCNVNYSFKTIQSTGVQISNIKYTFRKDKTRLDALKRLQEFLPPNFIFQTLGNKKIWGRYLTQKPIADFTLKCKTSLDYSEDTSIYTRTKFYGRNENPTNICWQPGLSALVTGEAFTSIVNNQDLTWIRKEGNFQVYSAGTTIKNIITSTFQPRVRVNGVLIDDKIHEVLLQPIIHERRHDSYNSRGRERFFLYWWFAHKNIDPVKGIHVYDADGTPNKEVPYFNSTTNPTHHGHSFLEGWLRIGPNQETDSDQNARFQAASTASYYVHWSLDKLAIDFAKGEFKISQSLISDSAQKQVSVTADFEYQSVIESIDNADFIIDGRWETQAQTVFWTKPAAGFVFLRLDLGDIYNIQIIDLVAGFFRPEEDSNIRLDMTNTYTLQYSLDNITYYDVCKKAKKFQLTAGQAISFEIEDLEEDFKARYLQIVVEDMSKITYRGGCWVVAFTDLACYSQSILIGEAKLTSSQELETKGADTYLTEICNKDDAILTVDSTSDFAAQGTAYVENDEFSYTSLTSTTFAGCIGLEDHGKFAKVIQSPLIYDTAGLLRMKDRIYKDIAINEYLSTQKKVNARAYNWLREFIKDHSKCSAQTVYGPHYRPGMTVRIIDTINKIDERYFIEAVQVNADSQSHPTTITLSRYP